MEIRQIKFLIAIAEAGSFSTAAENLYISQSSLSKQIIALESELGVQLLDRSKRQISFTAVGTTFLKHARKINNDFEAMMADLNEYILVPNALDIVAIPVIAQYGITSCIAQFRNSFPSIQFHLEEKEASVILPAIENHQFELAFVRDNYVDACDYDFQEICSDNLVGVVAKSHHLAKKKKISLKEMAAENFILYDQGTLVYELSIQACRSAGFVPKISHTSSHTESIIGLVASRFGVALMMSKVIQFEKRKDIAIIPLEEKIQSNIVIAWQKHKRLSKSAKVFIDFIQKAYQTMEQNRIE